MGKFTHEDRTQQPRDRARGDRLIFVSIITRNRASQLIKNMKTIEIPAIGRVPAFTLDPMNRAQVKALCARFRAYVTLSKSAWEAMQTRTTPKRYAALEAREKRMGANAEALIAPLGIKCDWPGLYPSFTVNGFGEHTVESAVLSALGHPRNWLRGEGAK